jgi:hypothetical protein
VDLPKWSIEELPGAIVSYHKHFMERAIGEASRTPQLNRSVVIGPKRAIRDTSSGQTDMIKVERTSASPWCL